MPNGTKSRTLYTTVVCINMTYVAESANSSVWHNRLGHLSVRKMKILAVKGVLESLKFVDMGLC